MNHKESPTHDRFSLTHDYIEELEQAAAQDRQDAARFRWLCSRIENGGLAISQTTPGLNSPWLASDFKKTIDDGLNVERSLDAWLQNRPRP